MVSAAALVWPRAEVSDNNESAVTPINMLAELCVDNQRLTRFVRSAHKLCDGHNDVATTSSIENWIDEAEGRTRFLSEISRAL